MSITFNDLKSAFTTKLKENIFAYIENNKDEKALSQKILVSNMLNNIIDENNDILESKIGQEKGKMLVDFINDLEKENKSLKSNNTLSLLEALYIYSEQQVYSDQFGIVDIKKNAEKILSEIAATNFSIKEIKFSLETYLDNTAYNFFKNLVIYNKGNYEESNCLIITNIDCEDYLSNEDASNEGLEIFNIIFNKEDNANSFINLIKVANAFYENFMVVETNKFKKSLINKAIKDKFNKILDIDVDLVHIMNNIMEETVFINGIFHQEYFKEISKKIADKYSEHIVALFSHDLSDISEDNYLLRYALQNVIKNNKLNTSISFDEMGEKYLLTLNNNAVYYLLQDFILTNDTNLINGIKFKEKYNDVDLAYRLDNKDTMFILSKESFKNLDEEKAINLIIECLKNIVINCSVDNNLYVTTESGDLKLSQLLIQMYRRDYLLEKLNNEDEKNSRNKKKL